MTNEITKHKARLNLHGGMQELGVNYFATYAPVVTWFAIRLVLVLSIINNWHMRQIDFVMAYPQAPIECDMFMQLPHGIVTKHGDAKDHVLKLVNNLYGQKQAGRVWNHYLVMHLLKIGFIQSKIDECVFYRKMVIFIVYVDDGIFAAIVESDIYEAMADLANAGLDLEDQGSPADYIGVNINRINKDTFELTQPALARAIVNDVGIGPRTPAKPVPASPTKMLHPFLESPPFDGHFSYRSVVGKLNYIAQCTHPELMYSVNSCARFSSNPRKEHGEALEYIAKYLKDHVDDGIQLTPSAQPGIPCLLRC